MLLGWEETVQFIGPVFGERKIQFWQQVDVFIFPTYSEDLPYSLLERMASGIAVITSLVGGIPDVMKNGIRGLFVDPGNALQLTNAIQKLISCKEELQNMSMNCRTIIRKDYGIHRMTSQFLEVFNKL